MTLRTREINLAIDEQLINQLTELFKPFGQAKYKRICDMFEILVEGLKGKNIPYSSLHWDKLTDSDADLMQDILDKFQPLVTVLNGLPVSRKNNINKQVRQNLHGRFA
jgi:hypothetical protein